MVTIWTHFLNSAQPIDLHEAQIHSPLWNLLLVSSCVHYIGSLKAILGNRLTFGAGSHLRWIWYICSDHDSAHLHPKGIFWTSHHLHCGKVTKGTRLAAHERTPVASCCYSRSILRNSSASGCVSTSQASKETHLRYLDFAWSMSIKQSYRVPTRCVFTPKGSQGPAEICQKEDLI